ncbi:MAG: hypothetical protein IKK57_05630 [Clostridia bacterium]|nr:hypothetical protein [Clostridia bacterium]
MNVKNRKVVRGICIAAVLGILLLFLFFSPIVLFCFSDMVLKGELDNVYVNVSYEDWKEVDLPGMGAFMLPYDWNLICEDSYLHIVNANSDVIAVGDLYSSSDQLMLYRKSNDTLALLSYICGDPIEEYDYKSISGINNIDRCSIFQITTANSDHNITALCLSLIDPYSNELYFVFPFATDKEATELQEILQAIMYSFVIDE